MKDTIKLDAIEIRARGLDVEDKSLILGAKASLQMVYEFPECPDILRNTLRKWTVWQKRVEFSVERVVLSPNLAPQLIAALFALGAQVVFDIDDGAEPVLSEYLRRTGQSRGKIVAITLPLNLPRRVWGEAHVCQTPTGKPIVSAIAVIDLENGDVRKACLALTGTWRENVRLAESAEMLVNGPLIRERIEQVISALQQEVTPQDDYRSSADYRRAMACVTAQRALEACMKRAKLQ